LQLDFESAEHVFLGDNTILKFKGGKTFQAVDKQLELLNKLSLTYREIIPLQATALEQVRTLISDSNTIQDNFMRA